MTLKNKIAFGLNGVVALIALILGGNYIARSTITSYHKEVIGVEWESLAPGVQKLLIILMKGTGDAVFVGGLAIVLFLIFPFRKGENWSRWALLLIGAALLLPMLIGAIYLATKTGASSPWWLNAILLLFMVVAFFLFEGSKEQA